MKKAFILTAILSFAAPALSSEIGMSSSYGTSTRAGTGNSAVFYQSNSQLTETNYFGSVKYGASKSSVVDPLNVESTASTATGARNFTESTTTTGRLIEDYSFGSTSTTNFTGVFAR